VVTLYVPCIANSCILILDLTLTPILFLSLFHSLSPLLVVERPTKDMKLKFEYLHCRGTTFRRTEDHYVSEDRVPVKEEGCFVPCRRPCPRRGFSQVFKVIAKSEAAGGGTLILNVVLIAHFEV
jgi:hypothetical protein